jgi:hypothetical protein
MARHRNTARRCSLLVLWAGLAGMAVAPAAAAQTDASDADEIAVYRVVLDSLFVRPRTTQVIVPDSTSAITSGMMELVERVARRISPGLPTEALANLRALNASEHALPAEVSASVPVRVLSRATIRDALPQDVDVGRQWMRFYQLYPGSPGVVGFSRVGFDTARRHAVLEVSNSCGGLCGSIQLVILRRAGDAGWMIEAMETLVQR